METTSMKELVEFNLETIDDNESIEVNLKNFMYIYRTLEEYMRFFHQPDHYPELKDIYEFLGTVDSEDAFHVLSEAIYDKLHNIKLPSHIEDKIQDGFFESEKFPHYYKTKE